MNNRIDVHHHIVPPAFIKAMDRHGIKEVAGAPLPNWSVNDSLSHMNATQTATAITSLSAPGVYFGDRGEAIALARDCNEFAANMRETNPGKFGNFAVLPMPFTDDACKEACYALDELNADGVVLLGSTEGYFLGDERFDELMEELNKRCAVVFIHPNLHATSNDLHLNTPGYLVEFLCDTTRAATNLIFSGTMERFPDIKWILAHAGGFLPYIPWRLSLANFLPEMQKQAPQGVMHYLKRFYFDTALSPSPQAMSAILSLSGPDKILFGSDFPFAPSIAGQMQTRSLDRAKFLERKDKLAIQRSNALSLFPQFAMPNEPPSPAEGNHGKYAKTSLLPFLYYPLIKLADHLRHR